MEEVLNISDIHSRFTDEWILVENPVFDESHHVAGGTVRAHSKDRDEVYRKAIELKPPKRFAILYTGTIPENTAVVL